MQIQNLTKKENVLTFINQNSEFFDFLFIEGLLEGKKGVVSVVVNEKFEPILGGIEEGVFKRRKYFNLGN